jgi:hypothetical protein
MILFIKNRINKKKGGIFTAENAEVAERIKICRKYLVLL